MFLNIITLIVDSSEIFSNFDFSMFACFKTKNNLSPSSKNLLVSLIHFRSSFVESTILIPLSMCQSEFRTSGIN